MSSVLGRGLAFPFGVDARGAVALVGDEADVEQAIGIILSTAPGERPMRPEFGCRVHDCVFDTLDARTLGRIDYEVRVALDRWEPRIVVRDVALDVPPDAEPGGDGVVHIQVRYEVKATNDVRNIVHPFYVIPAEDGA